MTNRVCCLATAALLLAASAGFAQDEGPPLRKWTAPPYWTPTPAPREGGLEGDVQASAEGMTASAQALPSSPLPFVAITPCRIVDTRVAVSDGFHQPNFSDNETRTFTLPSSPDCTGLPATAGAWSLNVQFRPIAAASYITLFPAGTTMPTVSTLTASPAAWVEDAAIVPAGTGGAIDVYCQFAGRVVIDINGYYGPHSVVTSLNTMTGDLTLAPGSNIAIIPSAGTLTIAMTGVPGGTLPAGAASQTLYSNGSGWLASSALTNDGTNVGISGNLSFPNTTATTGQIKFGGNPFIHNYGSNSTFVGVLTGTFTMTGGYNTGIGSVALPAIGSGGSNTAVGAAALFADSSGSYNTGVGASALFANGTASQNTAVGSGALSNQSFDPGAPWVSDNTAVGYEALLTNQPDATITGIRNTAVGSQALYSNTNGAGNTAIGYQCLGLTTSGDSNTAIGYAAGYSNTTGFDNTFLGFQADPAADNLTNATAIGHFATVDASNHVRIGDTFVTQIGGQVAWSNLSDARAKTDIRDLDLGLVFVMALRPVSYALKSGDGRTDMGFLAQDVEALLGDGYSVLGIGGDPDRMLSLRYTDLIAPLVKAVQEQQATIAALKAELDELHHEVQVLREEHRTTRN